jgi:hypothetical protein
LLAVDEEPLREECGKCFPNEANELECPSHNRRAIFPTPGEPDPQVEKPIGWAFAAPDVVGGNLPGKKQITELQAVECGQKYKCFGCPEIVIPGQYPDCEKTDPLPWKIKPRQLAGEDCHSYDGNPQGGN